MKPKVYPKHYAAPASHMTHRQWMDEVALKFDNPNVCLVPPFKCTHTVGYLNVTTPSGLLAATQYILMKRGEFITNPHGNSNHGRHICKDCPECCNPHHIIPGSSMDNQNDTKQQSRSTKLNPEKVIQIRMLWLQGHTQASLAEHFNVSLYPINRIIQDKAWRDIATTKQLTGWRAFVPMNKINVNKALNNRDPSQYYAAEAA